MTLPVGVPTVAITAGPYLAPDGTVVQAGLRITLDRRLVHTASGAVLEPGVIAVGVPQADGSLVVNVPPVNAPGFTTTAGQAITMWSYVATVTKAGGQNVDRVVQPLAAQTVTDLDLIPATAELVDPVTGSLQALATALAPYLTGGGGGSASASKVHVPSRYVQTMADELPFTTAPTFTDGASDSTVSTLTDPRNYPTVIADAINPLFTYSIMDPTVAGGGIIALDASAPDRYINYDHAFATSFDFDGQVFEIDNQWNDLNRVSLRVWANERETATFTGVTSANRHLLKVDFGSRAYRRVTLESDSANLLLGINVPGTDTITKATPRSPLKLAVVGDSLSLGVGVKGYAPSARSYALTMARCLGFTNWFRYGISGSGFISGGSSYLTRIGPVVNGAPDVVLVQGSYNDTANPALQAAAVEYLNALHAALPDALIVLCGSLQSTGNDTGVAAMNTVLAAAAAAAGVPFIDTRGWITAGNKARYSAPDYGDHLTYDGAVFMGRQLAREFARVLGVSL